MTSSATPPARLARPRRAYESLAAGDFERALSAFHPDVEWLEPDVPDNPVAGLHHGHDELGALLRRADSLCEEFAVEADDFIDAGDRVVVTGRLTGRLDDEELTAPFAHVWEMSGDLAVRGRGYGDTAALALVAARTELSQLADVLFEQASALRRQSEQLGPLAGGAAVSEDDWPPSSEEAPMPAPPPAGNGNGHVSSARLVAVDMAQEGRSREEIETYLRDELGIDDGGAILEEVFADRPQRPAAARRSRRFPRTRG